MWSANLLHIDMLQGRELQGSLVQGYSQVMHFSKLGKQYLVNRSWAKSWLDLNVLSKPWTLEDLGYLASTSQSGSQSILYQSSHWGPRAFLGFRAWGIGIQSGPDVLFGWNSPISPKKHLAPRFLACTHFTDDKSLLLNLNNQEMTTKGKKMDLSTWENFASLRMIPDSVLDPTECQRYSVWYSILYWVIQIVLQQTLKVIRSAYKP